MRCGAVWCAGVCADIFYKVTALFGRYKELLLTVGNELCASIYSDCASWADSSHCLLAQTSRCCTAEHMHDAPQSRPANRRSP